MTTGRYGKSSALVAFFVVIAGCDGAILNLGGEAGAPEADAGDATTGETLGGVSLHCDVPPPGDGGGAYLSQSVSACTAPRGAAHAVASASAMASLVLGTWSACNSGVLAAAGNASASAVQLTADGKYILLKAGAGPWLEPFDASAQTGGASAGGTYEVVDGAADFGAGTFELRFHPSGGGVAFGQITIFDAPTQIVFAAPNALSTLLVRSVSTAPFAAACACDVPHGEPRTVLTGAAAANAMAGRWVICGGSGFRSAVPSAVGFELLTDRTWYALVEDDDGGIVRGPGGSVQVDSGALYDLAFCRSSVCDVTAIAVGQDPPALFLAGSTATDDAGGAAWTTYLPLP